MNSDFSKKLSLLRQERGVSPLLPQQGELFGKVGVHISFSFVTQHAAGRSLRRLKIRTVYFNTMITICKDTIFFVRQPKNYLALCTVFGCENAQIWRIFFSKLYGLVRRILFDYWKKMLHNNNGFKRFRGKCAPFRSKLEKGVEEGHRQMCPACKMDFALGEIFLGIFKHPP